MAERLSPTGDTPDELRHALETSAYASLQYFASHAHVIFFGAPQVIQVRVKAS
jgi:hypothetical protein